MDKLIIVGCSWGCGEWTYSPEKTLALNHPGLNEYLSTDYTVVNLSECGASNWQTCFSLRNYLEYRVDRQEPVKIFVIQTDASRAKVSDKFDVDYESMLQKSTGLEDYYKTLLEIFYIKLHNLAEQYGVKIHMIGGLTDLDLESMSLYNNLVPCCESWIKLLEPTHQPSQIPLVLDSKLFVQAKKHNNINLVEDVINCSDQSFVRAQQLMETDYFGPGFGDYHPSRKAHEVLSNYIKNYLKDLS
jgi:hypothetical protein